MPPAAPVAAELLEEAAPPMPPLPPVDELAAELLLEALDAVALEELEDEADELAAVELEAVTPEVRRDRMGAWLQAERARKASKTVRCTPAC